MQITLYVMAVLFDSWLMSVGDWWLTIILLCCNLAKFCLLLSEDFIFGHQKSFHVNSLLLSSRGSDRSETVKLVCAFVVLERASRRVLKTCTTNTHTHCRNTSDARFLCDRRVSSVCAWYVSAGQMFAYFAECCSIEQSAVAQWWTSVNIEVPGSMCSFIR